MNTIKKFDDSFIKLTSYTRLMCNVSKYIISFFVVLMMLVFPSFEKSYNLQLILITALMFDFTLYMHLLPYLYITQDRVSTPIYKLLRDTPITRKDFIRSRLIYSFDYLKKLTPACIVTRLFGIFVLETPSLENILMSAFGIILLVISSIFETIGSIYSASRY